MNAVHVNVDLAYSSWFTAVSMYKPQSRYALRVTAEANITVKFITYIVLTNSLQTAHPDVSGTSQYSTWIHGRIISYPVLPRIIMCSVFSIVRLLSSNVENPLVIECFFFFFALSFALYYCNAKDFFSSLQHNPTRLTPKFLKRKLFFLF